MKDNLTGRSVEISSNAFLYMIDKCPCEGVTKSTFLIFFHFSSNMFHFCWGILDFRDFCENVEFTCRIFFLNDIFLLKIPTHSIRQTIAHSKRLDDYTSAKPNENSQKIFHVRNVETKLKKWEHRQRWELPDKVKFGSLQNLVKLYAKGKLIIKVFRGR